MATRNQLQYKPPIQWSDIPQTHINLEKLKLLTPTTKQLVKDGLPIKPFTEQQMWAKMRCQNCGAKLKKYRPPLASSRRDPGEHFDLHHDNHDYGDVGALEYEIEDTTQISAEQQYASNIAETRAAGYFTQPTRHACFFHDGRLFKGQYECCNGRQNTKGCCSELTHLPSTVEELRKEWQMHTSPEAKPQQLSADNVAPQSSAVRGLDSTVARGPRNRGRGRGQGQAQTAGSVQRFRNNNRPPQTTAHPHLTRKCAAVALDCEMGVTTLGASILIRLTVIDFFTREVLIDSLVASAPPHHILHYNTRYSGVTFSAMNKAIRTGNVIHGADAARQLLFQHVDSETLIIVHGGDNDFSCLRWIHPTNRIIDTCILETYDPEVKNNGWKKNLKEVTWRRCNGIEIQNAKLANGRDAGHDSLEDAFACREIVAAWLRMIPDV